MKLTQECIACCQYSLSWAEDNREIAESLQDLTVELQITRPDINNFKGFTDQAFSRQAENS